MKPCSLFSCAAAFFLVAAATVHADESTGRDLRAQAAALSAQGNFDASLPLWRAALAESTQKQDDAGEMEASLGLADALNQLGAIGQAEGFLEKADQLAKKGTDKAIQARIESSLGEIYMLCTNPDDAEGLLNKSAALAKQTGDPGLMASTLNNLANLHSYQKKYDQADDEYNTAAADARKAGDPGLALKIEANSLVAAGQAQNSDAAEHGAAQVVAEAPGAPDSHEKAMALIGAGRAFLACFQRDTSPDNQLRLDAFHAYQQAEQTASRIQDSRALSYALGYQGELYQLEGRTKEALELTCHAAILAEDAKSADILFRWQWQVAKILNLQHEREEAITAYQSAITTLQSIRHDMALHYGNINYGSSFREAAGAIYYELADLLLQRADATTSDTEQQACFTEARATVEELKSAELDDYFQDDCANLMRARTTKVENISAGALVVYIIPLADRTEILASLPSGRIERFKSTATDATLEATATAFRFNLENRASYAYLDQGAQLYDWLIRPLLPLIAQSKIDTLVFVPDGALRTIPMAALYDGSHYLIENFAIATTPGLTLMDPKPLAASKGRLVVDALSQGVQGFDPLTYAKGEADRLKTLYHGDELADADFTKKNVKQEFTNDTYSIFHIASHGHFDSDVRKTFILTYDGKLSLNDMESMIKPSQLKDQPVELLSLSACQTAAGDDRAALGLAGVAVKAGARSAFATLWFVNDEASSKLVSDFYDNLHNLAGITKAKALQKAQIKLLSDPSYGHPCYWAPYLIIGNWL